MFIKVKYKNTIALKKWEKKRHLIKSCSFKDLVVEYLKRFDEPQHAEDILKYVSEFAQTNTSNLIRRGSINNHDTFRIYGKTYIGLTNHTYDAKQFECEEMDHFLYYDIKELIIMNKIIIE